MAHFSKRSVVGKILILSTHLPSSLHNISGWMDINLVLANFDVLKMSCVVSTQFELIIALCSKHLPRILRIRYYSPFKIDNFNMVLSIEFCRKENVLYSGKIVEKINFSRVCFCDSMKITVCTMIKVNEWI